MSAIVLLTVFWVGSAEVRIDAPAPPPPDSSTVHEDIRRATGLRFAVFESYVRRNIIRTRTPYGFKVKSVDVKSPGAKIGLERGDIVLKWDGKPIRKLETLKEWIDGAARKGESVTITIARRKKNASRWSRKRWELIEKALTFEK